MTSELSNFGARLRSFIELSFRKVGEATGTDAPGIGAEGAIFNDFALDLFGMQFNANAAYRSLCDARGVDPGSIAHWKEIPAVPTAGFKEFEFTCLSPEERTHVFHSSGTTAERPSHHFHNAESLGVYEASLWPWFCRNVLQDGQLFSAESQLAILTPPPVQAPHSSLVHMFEVVRRKLGERDDVFLGQVAADGSWTLDLEKTIAAFESCSRADATCTGVLVLGTAFSFVHLLDVFREQNISFKLPSGSRVMETGGYKGRSRVLPKAELHRLISKRLGIPTAQIICEYGMSELGSQAYDAPADSARTFHLPPWARAQVISAETGREVANNETGLIRVLDLANVFSVMAVQTEDLAVRRGDGFELIGRAEFADPRGCSLMAR